MVVWEIRFARWDGNRAFRRDGPPSYSQAWNLTAFSEGPAISGSAGRMLQQAYLEGHNFSCSLCLVGGRGHIFMLFLDGRT
jgi:hypothetical protein